MRRPWHFYGCGFRCGTSERLVSSFLKATPQKVAPKQSKRTSSKEAASKQAVSTWAAPQKATAPQVATKRTASKEAASNQRASRKAASKQVVSKKAKCPRSKMATPQRAATKRTASKKAASKQAASQPRRRPQKALFGHASLKCTVLHSVWGPSHTKTRGAHAALCRHCAGMPCNFVQPSWGHEATKGGHKPNTSMVAL